MSVLVALAPYADDEPTVSSAELRRAAGITYRQVDYWTRTGLLRPVGVQSPGSGNWRKYPQSEVRIARALRRLASLDRKNGYGALLRAAVTKIRRGETTFELIPGVTVDLMRLGAES